MVVSQGRMLLGRSLLHLFSSRTAGVGKIR